MRKLLIAVGVITMVLTGCGRDDFGKSDSGASVSAEAPSRGQNSDSLNDSPEFEPDLESGDDFNGDPSPAEPEGDDLSPGSDRVTDQLASRVALKGYQAMRGSSENVVISGLGLTQSLSIAALAASDSSVQEGILATLESSNDPGSLNASVAQLISDVSSNAAPGRLDLIPSVWIADDREIEQGFLEDLNFYHGIGARIANFRSGAREAMNTWFRNESEGYILDTVQPRSIPAESSFALVDATHFRGSWALPFDPELEYESTFRGLRSDLNVGMMVLNDSVLSAETDDAEMVVLPYESGFSLIAIKPRSNTPEGLERLEESLSLSSIDALVDQAQAGRLSVHFPRVQVGGRFDLDAADLPGLAGIRDGAAFENAAHGAILANVVQRTVVRFDRTQTTADPASEAPDLDASIREIRFDRPFIFVIRDTSTGTLVLAGRVGQPTSL